MNTDTSAALVHSAFATALSELPDEEGILFSDVLIVGGGPAGLSAALLLGRCRRTVLLVDDGNPRNAPSPAMHGYLSRDGMRPLEFLETSRLEAARYPTVTQVQGRVLTAVCEEGGFRAGLSDGRRVRSKKLLIATGVEDLLPALPRFADFYGRSIHHCPYCDGYEWSDAPLAVLAEGGAAYGLCLELLNWSHDLRLLCQGSCLLDARQKERLLRLGIEIIEDSVTDLLGEEGRLAGIRLASGRLLEVKALFFNSGQAQRSRLLQELGCEIGQKGTAETDKWSETKVKGLFVAGDASKDAQMVVVAASEGALAAVAINRELLQEDLALRERERERERDCVTL